MAKRTLVRRADNAARISYDDSTSELIFERYNTETAAWEESLKINLPAKRITTIADVDDDLKLNFGRTNKYALRYNSTNDTWVLSDEVNDVDVLEIGRNGVIRVIGNLNDDLELPFGADKDYAIAFDATDNVLEIRDKTNGTVYTFARNQNRNFGVFSKHRYAAETSGVTNGASGSPATVCSISVTASDFQTLLPLNFNATPASLATGETVTYRITATLDDGSTVDLYDSGGVSTAVSGTIADCDFTGIADGRRIVKLELTAESSETSPSSTSTGAIAGIEYD